MREIWVASAASEFEETASDEIRIRILGRAEEWFRAHGARLKGRKLTRLKPRAMREGDWVTIAVSWSSFEHNGLLHKLTASYEPKTGGLEFTLERDLSLEDQVERRYGPYANGRLGKLFLLRGDWLGTMFLVRSVKDFFGPPLVGHDASHRLDVKFDAELLKHLEKQCRAEGLEWKGTS